MIITLLTLLSSLAADTQVVNVTSSTLNQVGQFDGTKYPEISGMAVSSMYEHIYIHNDSGDSGRFFITDLTGKHIQTVNITDSSPSDNEDMSVGPCGIGTTKCLFIGDVGDNDRKRSSVRVVLVEEKETFSSSVPFLKTFKIKYSDGKAHNCEAIAVHPITGDMFLFEKTDGAGQLFKVIASDFTKTNWSTLTAREIGSVALNELFTNADQVITGMAISPDGKKFSFLAYETIYEFQYDLGNQPAVGTDQLIQISRARYQLPRLKQQEAISYNSWTGRLLYTTEASPIAPLIQVPTINF